MTSANAAARHDLYRFIHKGLRAALFDSVRALGLLDADDAGERERVLDRAERLLALLAAHVKHEDDFVHRAIEARQPGGAQHTAGDHREQFETLQALRAEIDAVRRAVPAELQLRLHRLYRHFALLAAENLEHMNVEETHNNELLWSLYSDDELDALHDRLLAASEPHMKVEAIGWIAEALNPHELAALLGDMRRKLPAPALAGVLGLMRERLTPQRWTRLAQTLGEVAEAQPA